MSFAFRELEHSERHVLGALRCIDLTSGAAIEAALQVSADGARLLRNRSGLYAILEWTGLAEHAADPNLQPKTLSLTVRDPAGRYLPRLVKVDLPRDPTPDNAGHADSLFRPIEAPMYPSPAAPVSANWAALRMSVIEADNGDALGGALIRVLCDGATIARGLTDWRGESLVLVAGIPFITCAGNSSSESGSITVREIATSVEVCFDAALGTQVPMSDVRAGHQPAALPLVDPADLENDLGTLPMASIQISLAAGRQYELSPMEITLP